MDWENLILFYGVLLVSLVVHEAAHATVALLGGDRTAYVGGQVTLNPVPHIQREPFGTVVVPLAMLIMSKGAWCMGWASTPIDPLWAHRHPRRAALMSAAGPLSNFLLAAIAFVALKCLVWTDVADPYPTTSPFMFVTPHESDGAVYALARLASVFAFLNIVLGVLNLLPWPPLDGSGVVGGLVPDPMERFYAFVRTQPILMILGLVAIWRLLPELFYPLVRAFADWM